MQKKDLKRCAGVFLHPSSLPSPFGIGDFGDEAYWWVNWLNETLQTIWQMCPLGPTGFGNSPYQCLSSFAGNTLLISPAKLVTMGLLSDQDTYPLMQLPHNYVDFDKVAREKEKLFNKAFVAFDENEEFRAFCGEHQQWLDDYALFMVCKELQKGTPWYKWDMPLRKREQAALDEVRKERSVRFDYHRFLQYVFFKQWFELKDFAEHKGVAIMGDIPIYVAYDSADVWANPGEFDLDAKGNRNKVAGVPPDYFSEDGQLWGNPLYRWDVMKENEYAWWMRRLESSFELYDIVRIDHFRAFEAYWAVSAKEKTAKNGKWVKGPGSQFFKTVKNQLGDMAIVAEDLGVITEKVTALREKAGLPGMKVLQFAFDGNKGNPYLTYNVEELSVLYTGTHDNDTSQGWFNNLNWDARQHICNYLGCAEHDFMASFIRHAYQSRARVCILPLQDIIGYGSEHRFNTPGTGMGNWHWRCTRDMIQWEKKEMIAWFTELYGRYVEPKPETQKN